jgi:hypothetical protein
VFPKQDNVQADEFGNALRGPLGIHQAVKRRYWFYGADYSLAAQMAYLKRMKKITEQQMAGFVRGLQMPPEFMRAPTIEVSSYRSFPNASCREFRILDHVSAKRKAARNCWTRCPSCALQGRDRSGDNLAISITDPRKYKCWAGCTKEMIRAALGCPIRRATAR